MSSFLVPAYEISSDIHFGDIRGRTTIVWFVDYICERTRYVRDMLFRSNEHFGPERLSLAIRMAVPESRFDEANLAARAAVSAHWQNRFAPMHLKLFDHTGSFDEETILNFASQLELDMDQFKQDLHSQRTRDKISNDHASFRASVDIPLPAIFIDDRAFDNVWDENTLIEAIEKPLGVRLNRASNDFVDWAASAGFALVTATILALLVANMGGLAWYDTLRHTPMSVGFADHLLTLSFEGWINDGLMSLFFLLVGIEIKREIVGGDLSSMQKAALPIIAAFGGMVVPASIYALFNLGLPTIKGWGVPMATDIAFTLGLMLLLGPKVPVSLKIFVSALAIADDLGAILVIALFYGHGLDLSALANALFVLIAMMVLSYGKVYSRTPYMLLFVILWFFVHESGVHATIAGAITAFIIPSRRVASIKSIALQASAIVDAEVKRTDGRVDEDAYSKLELSLDRLREPGFHLQHALQKWSNYSILPLFAFFNTGILIVGSELEMLTPEALGVVFGLVIGKPLGIVGSVYLATRFGLARLSSEISWQQLIGASFLAGIGFTMSIFIASAAFDGPQLESVKLATLLASAMAACIGMTILALAPTGYHNANRNRSADQRQ